jgi:hypothetical protein
MITLIAFALLHATPIQEKPIEERIEAFLKGDAAAREGLVKLGAFAIRPLQKARDKGPEKIDALVLELKKGAAYPKDSAGMDKLESKVETKMDKIALRDAVAQIQEATRLPLFCDKFEAADLKSDELTLEPGTVREVLDQICRQTGLDYGFFHNQVVLAKPDRLWHSGPGAKARPAFGLPGTERQHKTPDDERPLKQLRELKASFDFQNSKVTDIVGFMKEISGILFEIEGEGAKDQLSFRANNQSMFDILCLLTQSRDLDFFIKDKKVVIDTREGIEKKITGKK